ncbi:S8 family peptidase [Sphingomicrobium lutaoense]|uniref:Peptidase S8/S53 domain-containing protein n=1 Tax=Sphingomicrobium lutaoense TaxID=515949 RepID=A0A839YWG0_9SPHN|nr:S8 family serine peptidase [Sphingomicrobium lutaoense]MBB3763529.1 hypothetical protein [Sphingomicrobium lutaoense]
MKKSIAYGAASLALGASLASPAYAQDGDAIPAALLGTSIVTDQEGDAPPSGNVSEASTLQPHAIANYGVDPNYGNINPFYGDIGAFWGNINPFYGNINPFYGNINPFYGNISPFYGNINPFYGNISPFYGDISAFWGDINAFYGDISAFDSAYLNSIGTFWQDTTVFWQEIDKQWAAAGSDSLLSYSLVGGTVSSPYSTVQAQLKELVRRSEAQWGKAVMAKTGLGFDAGFAQKVFKRHGIDINDPNSLAALDEVDRALFFLDWHDSLMTFSGLDHVDHWMSSVNWTPAITQMQGGGGDAVIGMIDSTVMNDQDLADNVIWQGGSQTDLGGHGAGVASLLFGAHDGEGVMGIAPDVRVSFYNPFAAAGTADWPDITHAISALKSTDHASASIINLSLGESGWALAPGIAKVFSDPSVAKHKDNTVYVIAAGNDGLSQTVDLEWNFASDPSMILVGSTNPLDEISAFSNRPGTACLLDHGICHEQNRLYMRTIVAPGEMLLVSDGQGGVVRRSGTSFAAPLVSGAISLLHDRWPWLARNPKATTEIIFRSARDLGAPGPDPVYGWGMLDVLASQSPLDFNALSFTMYKKKGSFYRSSSQSAAEIIRSGISSSWEGDEVFFFMLERVGGTHRDFAVPLSSVLYGKKTNVGGSWQYLQKFVASRFAQWILSGGADSDGDGTAGFSDVRSSSAQVPGGWMLRYDASLPTVRYDGRLTPSHGAATLSDPMGKFALTMGYGEGSLALNGGRFTNSADHDRHTGGVNPVLGFASGESFAAASYQLGENTRVKLGYSENRRDAGDLPGLTPQERVLMDQLDDHEAHAFSVEVSHKVNRDLSLSAQVTRLREKSALLGTQTTIDDLLGQGTSTEALTLAAAYDAGHGIQVDLSATAARTGTASDQALATKGDVLSTAGQLAVTKHGLLGKKDALRLSVAQPLNVEKGEIEFYSLGVVDRQTGELGEIAQQFSIEGKRRVVGEAAYAAPLGDDGELSFFGRYESRGNPGETENYVFGGSFSLRF